MTDNLDKEEIQKQTKIFNTDDYRKSSTSTSRYKSSKAT